MKNSLLKERAATITHFFEELEDDDEREERTYRTLLVNFQHVRRAAIRDVLEILQTYKTCLYVDEVNYTLRALEKEVKQL